MKPVLENSKWRISNDQGRHLSKPILRRGSYWLRADAPKSVIRQYKTEAACKIAIKKINPSTINDN